NTRLSSSTSPVSGFLMRRSAANRGRGLGAAMRSSTWPATGPEMRTTATPARPWPLERAKMVAASGIGTPTEQVGAGPYHAAPRGLIAAISPAGWGRAPLLPPQSAYTLRGACSLSMYVGAQRLTFFLCFMSSNGVGNLGVGRWVVPSAYYLETL